MASGRWGHAHTDTHSGITRKYATPRPALRCVRIAGVRRGAGCAEGASNDEAAQSKQRERRRSGPRTTRTRHDKEAAERPEHDERRSRAARSTHARLIPRRSPDAESRDPHAPLACRERGASQHARAGEAEWRKEKRRQERHPPRGETVHPAHGTTCSTAAVRTTEDRDTSRRAAACRRRCAPWLHAEPPPTWKRSWNLAASSSPSSHPERFASEAPPAAGSLQSWASTAH